MSHNTRQYVFLVTTIYMPPVMCVYLSRHGLNEGAQHTPLCMVSQQRRLAALEYTRKYVNTFYKSLQECIQNRIRLDTPLWMDDSAREYGHLIECNYHICIQLRDMTTEEILELLPYVQHYFRIECPTNTEYGARPCSSPNFHFSTLLFTALQKFSSFEWSMEQSEPLICALLRYGGTPIDHQMHCMSFDFDERNYVCTKRMINILQHSLAVCGHTRMVRMFVDKYCVDGHIACTALIHLFLHCTRADTTECVDMILESKGVLSAEDLCTAIHTVGEYTCTALDACFGLCMDPANDNSMGDFVQIFPKLYRISGSPILSPSDEARIAGLPYCNWGDPRYRPASHQVCMVIRSALCEAVNRDDMRCVDALLSYAGDYMEVYATMEVPQNYPHQADPLLLSLGDSGVHAEMFAKMWGCLSYNGKGMLHSRIQRAMQLHLDSVYAIFARDERANVLTHQKVEQLLAEIFKFINKQQHLQRVMCDEHTSIALSCSTPHASTLSDAGVGMWALPDDLHHLIADMALRR